MATITGPGDPENDIPDDIHPVPEDEDIAGPEVWREIRADLEREAQRAKPRIEAAYERLRQEQEDDR